MRFALLYAAILTAALFAVSLDQAHAVPDFRDGWVDQGGKWHPFFPSDGGDGQIPDGSSGDTSNAAGDSPPGDNDTSGEPDGGVSGSNTILDGTPFDGGPHAGSSGGSGVDGSTGGTQNGGAAGSSVNLDGSHVIPEPASIALLGCALLAAGAAGRRSREKQQQQFTAGDCP